MKLWISIDGCDFLVNAGEFLSLVLQTKRRCWKVFFFVEICFSSLFFISGSFNVSVLISSMQRVFVVFWIITTILTTHVFVFLCVVWVCLCFCLVCFDPFNNHEDKIKGNESRTLYWVFCFNIIIHLFFCRFCIRRSAASQLEIEFGIPSFNRGLFCVLAIKTVTLFNYNFLGKKYYRYFVFASHISCLW